MPHERHADAAAQNDAPKRRVEHLPAAEGGGAAEGEHEEQPPDTGEKAAAVKEADTSPTPAPPAAPAAAPAPVPAPAPAAVAAPALAPTPVTVSPLAATPLPSSVATATPLPSTSATATPIAAGGGGSSDPVSSGPVSRAPETKAKPFLASEALIEDLAPLEPSGSAARLWCGALGLGFLLFGSMTLAGVGAGGALEAAPEIVLGLIAMLGALVRLTYRQRAVMMVLLGLLSAVAGLRGFAGGQGWGLLRTLTAIVLPAALLFRARYRAYAPARWILGIAVALSLPFVIVSILHAAQGELGLSQSGAAIAVVAVGASLLGFMGSETTGGGTATALGVVIALAVDLALRGVWAPDAKLTVAGAASIIASSAVFAGTSAMASLGLFQILAWRFAADARRINLHAERKEQKRKAMPSSDWSTKD